MALPDNAVAIHVPETFRQETGVLSFTVADGGAGTVTGLNGAEVATVAIASAGSTKTFTLQRTGATPLKATFDVLRNPDQSIVVSGNIAGNAFDVTVSADGKLVNSTPPKGIDPEDAKVLNGMYQGISAENVVDAAKRKVPGNIKIDLPTGPPPYNPTKPEDKFVASGGSPKQPVPAQPDFHRAGCALAGVEILVSAILLQPEGIAFGFAGYLISC